MMLLLFLLVRSLVFNPVKSIETRLTDLLYSSVLRTLAGTAQSISRENPRKIDWKKIMRAAASQRWGYVRIIAGTIIGGIIGFYFMHRMENNYKEKMNERLRNYEAELKRKKQERLDEFDESS
ncbi:uncharacterized protein LOC107632955 [Arachis ipaensis]|uniref:uncharacterized protein LOC107632955 n=1 Tax=Arachis ipaensis TaxID=130454 RepID=UPI000A2B1462|nr:uncharacterized protein LOC107632955 [Arachis ipaensis]